VIFDCDGVLVDSEGISNRVLAEMLTAEGLPTTQKEALRDYKGLLLTDVVGRAEGKLGHALPRDWSGRYETERASAFRRELRPMPAAAETVERVMVAGIGVCVASQGKLSKTALSLQLTGLERLFAESARFSAHSVPNGKPAPDLFLHAASSMGAEPAGCVVVEDTALGIAAAVSAGMHAVGFASDGDRQALHEAGAADILDSLAELPPLLGLTGGGAGTSARPA
jgi:HAD superfamily hydrolase (TIGR01509 family)